MIKPKHLFPGARVALLGLSGPVPSLESAEKAVQSIRDMGLEPVVYPTATERHGYLAGVDAHRARDINAAFADGTIDGILCMRGGYGAHRIMPMLDWEAVRRNPKPLYGYSDVTAMHICLNQIGGMESYHSPMPGTEWHKGLDAHTLTSLKAVLFGQRVEQYANPPGVDRPQTLVGGKAEGVLCGGNLSLVAASIGTPWAIETKGKLLFLEEVHEQPYRVDGMLTHLRNSGLLADCAGIVLGAFTGAEAEEPERSLTLEQVFDELIRPLGIPTISGLVCGHCLPSLSLPLGRKMLLDADAGILRDAQ